MGDIPTVMIGHFLSSSFFCCIGGGGGGAGRTYTGGGGFFPFSIVVVCTGLHGGGVVAFFDIFNTLIGLHELNPFYFGYAEEH